MYTVKVNGTKYPVSAKTYFSLTTPFVAYGFIVFAWFGYMIYLGSHMISYHTGVDPMVAGIIALIFVCSLSVGEGENKTYKSILPKKAREILSLGLILGTFHYMYAVEGWNIIEVALLTIPLIMLRFSNSVRKHMMEFMNKTVIAKIVK